MVRNLASVVFVLSCALQCPAGGAEVDYVDEDEIPELAYLDPNADPCDDFYAFACGNFHRVRPMPEGETVWDNFALLRREISDLTATILASERRSDDPRALQKAKAVYAACLDVDYADMLELAEKGVVEALSGWPMIGVTGEGDGGFSWEEIGRAAAEYGISLLFTFSVTQNLLDANENVVLFAPDTLADPTVRTVRSVTETPRQFEFDGDAFSDFANKIARRLRDSFGSPKTDREISEDVRRVREFAEKLEAGGVAEEGAAYDTLSTFVTVRALQNWTDAVFDGEPLGLDWLSFFNAVFGLAGVEVTEDTKIMRSAAASTDVIYGVLNLILRSDPEVVKNFAVLRVLTYAAADSDGFMREAFEDYYRERTNESLPEREEYCLQKVTDYPNVALNYALVHEYQKYHFDVNKLSVAAEMVRDLTDAFLEVVDESAWMDEPTKEAAKKKAEQMITLLAYPDFVEDERLVDAFYENLGVCGWDHFGNSQRLRAFGKALDYSNVGKARDRELWNYSPLYTNAFYGRTHNRMLFPVAMLNPVFFDGNVRVLDYSRIGAIVGHEITHGFDSTGRYYNEEGTYGASWWSAEAAAVFAEKQDCFKRQYSSYYVEEIDAYVDGALSLDENIADNGGLEDAYRAFRRLSGRRSPLKSAANYTLDQLFFVGFGTMWCTTETDDYLRSIVKSAYSPARFRVNGVVSNNRHFAEAFDCPAGSRMNPEEKCTLW